jgi:microcompartment protein CcmK/EutM
VSSAGDVNGDGFDDLIIGAFFADPNGDNYAGESFVVFGGVGVGASGTIELSSLNGANGFVLNGIDQGDQSGRSVSSAGDVNGDGFDDLIIGATGAAPNGNKQAGESYVVFGGVGVGASGTIELSSLNGTNGFVLNGIDVRDFSGQSVSSAGDVNGDGVDDLIIGARDQSYVVFGRNLAPCPADIAPVFGTLDVNDVIAFVGSFNFGLLPVADLSPPGGDGVLNVNDIIAFVTSFNAGCP